jgi:hypothetical protein
MEMLCRHNMLNSFTNQRNMNIFTSLSTSYEGRQQQRTLSQTAPRRLMYPMHNVLDLVFNHRCQNFK